MFVCCFDHVELNILSFRIFSCMNQVFINQLCTWLLYGELRDPYQEFFIFRNPKDDTSDTFLSTPSTTNTCDKSLVSTVSTWHLYKIILVNFEHN